MPQSWRETAHSALGPSAPSADQLHTVGRGIIIVAMIWFKLVGAVDDPVDENWAEVSKEIFTEIHFPRNKRPNKLSNGEGVILYAVGTKVLIATQTVASTLPASRERKGLPGSPEYRWPWQIDVETHHFCSPLKDAPKLREVAPEFARRYAGKFWEGSHWEIDEPEYKKLAAEIEAAGRPFQP